MQLLYVVVRGCRRCLITSEYFQDMFNGISVKLFWRLEVEEFAKKRIEVLLFYLNC